MDGFRVRAVQFPVQLPTLVRQCETVRPYPSQGVSPRVRVSQAPPDLTTRTPSRALVAVTEMTPTEIRSITERIEARLESIAEELADLAMLRLRESIDAGGTELPVDERRLIRARRAVMKAAHMLEEADDL